MRTIAAAGDPARTIRIPADVLARLREAAQRNGRSQNTEIVQRLVESLERDTHAKSASSA
ncbi:MAG: Arc family DNA-binding protein [Pseudomonadota bacterium]